MNIASVDNSVPLEAEVVSLTQESRTIFKLNLRFTDAHYQENFRFEPGQFNMLYLYGVGQVPISISSDPDETKLLTHTIRAIGRVTKALQKLSVGARVGVRGPFGRGWPLAQAEGKDVVIITGGLGCAPAVSVIEYMLARRNRFGKITILQGVKHSDDLIFRQQYAKWRQLPQVEVHIAADQAGANWPWYIGYVTDMITPLQLQSTQTMAMLCGPEKMMQTAIQSLLQKGLAESQIYLSMERNMECGNGRCGHCQYGGYFVCKDGPIFAYREIKSLLMVPGF